MAGIQAGGGSAGRLSIEIVAEVARLQADMDKVRRLVKDASGDIAKSASAANDNLGKLGSGISSAGTTSKLAGHHTRNLAFQFQDLSVQMAAAAGSSEPLKMAMMALLQQGAQIQGIMSQAGIGVKGLIVAIGGMLAPFLPVIAVAGVLAAAIGAVTARVNESSKVHVTFMDTALGAWDAFAAYVKGEATGALDYFGLKAGDVWNKVVEWTKWAANRMIGLMSLLPRALLDNWKLIPAGAADIFFSTVNVAIDAINSLISKSVNGINGFIATANGILSKANMALPTLTAPQIAKVTNSYAGAGAKLGKGLSKTLGDTLQRDFIGDIADKISPFAQARAVERMKKDAKKAGKEAGSHLGKAAGEKAVEDLLETLKAKGMWEFMESFMKDQQKAWDDFNERVGNTVQAQMEWDAIAIAKAREESDAYAQSISNLVSDLSSLGKVGGALGGLLGIVTGNTGSLGGSLGTLLNMDMMGKDEGGKEAASTIGKELSKVFKPNGEFGKMVNVLKNAGIGMAASSALLGKQSGSEQAGSSIGGALGGKIGEKVLTKGFETIAKGLGDFAGPLGSIAGGILGSVVGGLFKKAKWGRVDLTSAGASEGRGNSGGSEKAALAAGNSILSGLKDLALKLGGAIGDFGSIAVGVRNDEYRVNAKGTSLKVKKGAVNFGEDAEAAVAYAMKLAIERGAIRGIRQSTNNLLKAGDDLQAQLSKALSFEAVFTQLHAELDPVGAALDDLGREFDQLRAIFREAGATAEEYAQLERLLSIRRQEALDQERDALEDIRSRIAEAQGDDAMVKQIARVKELKDALNDNVRAELQRLYAVEDAMDAQQKLTAAQSEAAAAAQQLQDAWASIGSDLMDEVNRIRGLTGGDASASFATLLGQFNAATGAARGGNQEAAKRLTDLSQSLLEVAANTATSRQELDRIKAQTAASLEATYVAIRAMTDAPANTPAVLANPVSGANVEAAGAKAVDALADQVRALREELAALRRENADGHAATSSAANRSARVLENVSSASGGDAIAVANGT